MMFTKEQLAKAKEAKTVEELLALAAENGVDLTAEEAELCFAQLQKEGEERALADKELDDVAGGSQCSGGKTYSSDPPYYLITTAFNSCKSCVVGGKMTNGYCKDCAWSERSGMVLYCTFRKKGHDIYN